MQEKCLRFYLKEVGLSPVGFPTAHIECNNDNGISDNKK